MDTAPECELTTMDASVLEVMLQRHGHGDGPFVRLLRSKLSAATIVFQDAIDPRTATINSRVELSVDGGPAESRILAYGGEDAYPGIALPITTLRGLAVLGLTAPVTIVCERPDGSIEELQLRRILHQPEAARRHRTVRSHLPLPASRPDPQSSVVRLDGRRRVAPRSSAYAPLDPDGDDPGPQAA